MYEYPIGKCVALLLSGAALLLSLAITVVVKSLVLGYKGVTLVHRRIQRV